MTYQQAYNDGRTIAQLWQQWPGQMADLAASYRELESGAMAQGDTQAEWYYRGKAEILETWTNGQGA